ESALLEEVREHSQAQDREGMQVSPYEGQLLQSLVRWTGSQRILELGTLFGYSALWMASAIESGGQLVTVEKDAERFKTAKSFFAKSSSASLIHAMQGDIEELQGELSELAPFDFLFIDANKGGYWKALKWGETILKKGGFVVADNTFMFGGVYGAEISDRWSPSVVENMKRFNARVADTRLYQGSMIPTPEGLIVAQKLF
ncbi:MAG: class I SAM-dependent methyltransferase, partial [Pseudomonadota bacterium]